MLIYCHNHSVYITVSCKSHAQHTRFEFWAVRWQSGGGSIADITANERFPRLSFSFIDLIVDLLAPMEELLCGT